MMTAQERAKEAKVSLPFTRIIDHIGFSDTEGSTGDLGPGGGCI